ncbi:MAG: DMT family transporter [Pseudoxanthomonas sp.]|nr:DMT family transporter [Pseudoxanthomonas sp.]
MPAPASTGEMAEPNRARARAGIAYGLGASLIWGGYIAVTYQGTGAGLDAADLAFLRYAIAGLLLLPWLLRHDPLRLAGIGWRRGIVLAFLAGPPFVFIGASGFAFAPLAHSAVIQLGAVTLMGIVLSAVIAHERQGRRRAAGLAVIVAGLAVIAGPGLLDGGSQVWKGDLMFFTAGTMWALFTVFQRRWQAPALAATAVVSVLSGLVYAPLYLAWRGVSRLADVAPTVVLGQAVMLGVLSGVVALFAFGRTVEHLGPGRASLFPALAPGVAILIGIPLAGTVPTAWQVTGLLVLSSGLLQAIQASPRREPHRRETTACTRGCGGTR